MNLNHLYYFVTLAHLEHCTKAANELSITQPSLSHAISTLENELGTYLFEKQGRNIVLTKYGKVFLEYVEQSLNTLETGIKKTKSMTSSRSGQIDLAFIYTLGTHFIPQMVNKFLEENKDMDVNFTFNSAVTGDIIKGLKDEKFDIGFCSKIESENEVEFIPIFEQELVVIVPENHELANLDSVDLNDIIEYKQVMYSKNSGLRPVIDNLFVQIGKEPNIGYEVAEDGAVAGLVAEKFGIAVVPNIPLLQYLNIKILKITNPSYKRYIYLARIKNKYLPPVVIEFCKFILKNSEIDSY